MTKPSDGAQKPIELAATTVDGRAVHSDWLEVFHTHLWLSVLSSRRLYAMLTRAPVPAHLAGLIDVFAAYAARGSRYHEEDFEPVPWEQREPLARKLRALMEAWTPPELPQAITHAARELVEAEGLRPPEGGWENLEHDKPCPLEDVLLWPEGIPVALRATAG